MSLTLALIVVTVVVSMAAFQRPELLERLLLWPPGVDRGQWWRLLSCGFVHGDGAHLAFNMITLYFFGSVMEGFYTARIGAVGWLGFYAAGLVVSSLPSWWRHRGDSSYRSLGASGAVSAVLFAFILLAPWATIYVFFLPVPAIVFAVVYLGYTFWADRQQRGRINHSAHLWGAGWGVFATLAIAPEQAGLFVARLLQPFSG